MTSIGENIKRLRNERDWSQAELGEKIGKTRTAIWQYERGETEPRMGVVEDLARVFGVPKSEIVDRHVEYSFVNFVSDEESELVELYRRMPPKARHALLVGLRDYVGK